MPLLVLLAQQRKLIVLQSQVGLGEQCGALELLANTSPARADWRQARRLSRRPAGWRLYSPLYTARSTSARAVHAPEAHSRAVRQVPGSMHAGGALAGPRRKVSMVTSPLRTNCPP